MKKKIDWRNHLLELIVVFIGITAAFMLNNWREGYKDSQLENKYVSSFFDDLRADAGRLGRIIPANNSQLELAERFLWGEDQPDDRSADSAVVILGHMLSVNPFVQKRTTYESIRNSGNLSIISDYALREKLIAYYESYEEVQTKESIYFNWLNTFVIPFVYENMDLASQKIKSEESLKSYHFKNLVVGYHVLLKQNIEVYQTISDLNDRLRGQFSDRVEVNAHKN